MLRRRVRLTVLALGSVALIAAGCGDDDDDDAGGGAAATTQAAAPADTAASTAPAESSGSTAGPTIEELTGEGSYEADPPAESPPGAKGKTVWWISCGMSLPACSTPANSAKEAAGKLGIDFRIGDGKLDVGGAYQSTIRTALASKPDMLIIHGISCAGIKGPLQEAKRANVKVMGVEALDCSESTPGAESLFSSDMKYAPKALSSKDYFQAWGKITAQYMIAAMGGKMNYILNALDDPLGQNITIGFNEIIKTCSECKELDSLNSTPADGAPNSPWTQRLRPALLKNPNADAVMFPVDSLLTGAGGAKIVKEVNPKIRNFGSSGEAATLALIRAGTLEAATAAHSAEWMGYAAIDNANRALNDQETVPQGVGFRPVDKDHNLPSDPKAGYESPIDWKAAYEKAWSAAG